MMPMSWSTATARAPDGGRLVHHHQHAPVIDQLLVESRRRSSSLDRALSRTLRPVPAQGRGPVLCLTDARYR